MKRLLTAAICLPFYLPRQHLPRELGRGKKMSQIVAFMKWKQIHCLVSQRFTSTNQLSTRRQFNTFQGSYYTFSITWFVICHYLICNFKRIRIVSCDGMSSNWKDSFIPKTYQQEVKIQLILQETAGDWGKKHLMIKFIDGIKWSPLCEHHYWLIEWCHIMTFAGQTRLCRVVCHCLPHKDYIQTYN